VKKLIIPVAVVAIGASAFLYKQQQTPQQPAYNVLNYIPADTPVFSGQLTPFPIKDYLTSVPQIDSSQEVSLSQIFNEETPAIAFSQKIFDAYKETLANPELLSTNFGLADEIRAYFYTLGLLPVLKVEIANPQAFWAFLDKNEQEANFTHVEGTLKNQAYRSYRLTDDDVDAENTIDLIVSEANGILTFTVKTPGVSEQLFAAALGLDKATNSLAETGTLSAIAKQHNLPESNIGFINHVEIIKGLTTTDGNLIAKQLSALMKDQPESPLLQIQSAVCQQEFAAIAQNWPRTAFGYTQIDVTKEETTIGFSAIIESKNKVILDSLKSLRGYIPEFAQGYGDKAASVGIGFDVSNLSKSLTNIFSDLSTPAYQCAPLKNIQREVSQGSQQLAMLGMGANMAAGVKGLSAALFNYDVENITSNTPTLNSLDAMFAIHAKEPKALFDSLKMMLPGLSQLNLTVDGPAVALKSIAPLPPEFTIDPQIAIKGDHFVVYNGEAATKAADSLSNETLSANGLYQVAFDLPKLIAPVMEELEGQKQDLPPEILNLTKYDIRADSSLDINDQGIRIDSTVNSKPLTK